MMSDSFLYSSDDAVMMPELQHCHVAARECGSISSESKAGLSVGTSMAFGDLSELIYVVKTPFDSVDI